MTHDLVRVWARVPAYVVEDGMVPIPLPGWVLESGLGLRAEDGEHDGNPTVQQVEGELIRVEHLLVLRRDGVVLVVMPGPGRPDDREATHVRLRGEVVVEPYLWGPGPVRDAFPEGWARWTVIESYAAPSSPGREPGWFALLRQEPSRD